MVFFSSDTLLDMVAILILATFILYSLKSIGPKSARRKQARLQPQLQPRSQPRPQLQARPLQSRPLLQSRSSQKEKSQADQPPFTEEEKRINEKFARMRGCYPIVYKYVRPLNAPNPPDTCPVCLEDLFDGNGNAKKDVAKMMCIHLVHSECLQKAGSAMNSSGRRFGVGGLGLRAGCPICEQAVSFWTSSKKAADFPIFWMHRIQACLEVIGPDNGPVPIQLVRDILKQDSSLSSSQKQLLRKTSQNGPMCENGFMEALKAGGAYLVHEVVEGGPARDGGIRSGLRRGIWKYDRDQETLFLGKWE